MKKPAILIVCYNRPAHVKQCLAHLSRNADISAGLPVYVFMDGGPKSTQMENLAALSAFSGMNTIPVVKGTNIGSFNANTEAKSYVFDRGHDSVILLEEDVYAGPYYITLIRRVLEWLEKDFDNIGMVGSSIMCHMTAEEKRESLCQVVDTGASSCNFIMSKWVWDTIRSEMEAYGADFFPGVHTIEGIAKCHAWVKGQAARIHELGSRKFPCHWSMPPAHMYRSMRTALGQDAIMDLLLRCHGLTRATTSVNRVLHAGVVGENADENWYYQHGYDQVRLDIFEDDLTLNTFIPGT